MDQQCYSVVSAPLQLPHTLPASLFMTALLPMLGLTISSTIFNNFAFGTSICCVGFRTGCTSCNIRSYVTSSNHTHQLCLLWAHGWHSLFNPNEGKSKNIFEMYDELIECPWHCDFCHVLDSITRRRGPRDAAIIKVKYKPS